MNAKTIARRKTAQQPDGFEDLRREGIAFVQELSGDNWTDFNLHDPGVTILEHLCFALTDLIYRTQFPVQDFLASEKGEIDGYNLSLHSPQDILTCHPTTTLDLRKSIFDAVETIDNVWLETAGKGLYTITVRLSPDVSKEASATVVQEVRNAFYASRNLCEDIEDVVVLEEYDCELAATVDIGGTAEPAEILAQIYYHCARHLATGMSALTYQEILSGNTKFDEIFDGPLTNHGLVPEDELTAGPTDDRTDLFSIIRNVPGVEQIRAVDLRSISAALPSSKIGQLKPLPRLRIPQRAEDIKIALLRGNAVLPVALPAVLTAYNKLTFREKSLRHTSQDPGLFIPEPTGQYRDLRQYSSIQRDFPLVYGIGAYGLADSALPQDHARAFQLKAYLLLFEQVMANFLADLQNVRQLFLASGVRKSYVSQPLDNSVIPDIEPVYAEGGKNLAVEVLYDEYDLYRYADRKSRILDYQLAMYGDALAQFSLRQFDCYHPQDEIEETIIRNKNALLEKIVTITRDRAAAFNKSMPSWNTENVSGMAMRVGILLGLRYSQERSLSDVITEKGLTLVPDNEFVGTPDEGPVRLEFVDLGDIGPRVSDPFFGVTSGMTPDTRKKLFEDIVFLRKNVVSDSILRHGVRKDRYAVGAVGNGTQYQVALNISDDPDSDGRWLYLSTHTDKRAASEAANALRHFLIHLNIDSEGFHIVEHILLRPDGFARFAPTAATEDFYSFRVSIVLPAWPARFRNEDFRNLVEETFHLNCPAHIHPEFYWLEFRQMCDFEFLHMELLAQLCAPETSREGLRLSARAVEKFLKDRRGRE